MSYKFSKAQIKEAVLNSDGTYTDVAKQLGVRSHVTAKKYIDKFPDIKEEFNAEGDALCDKARHKASELLNSQDEHVAARVALFILQHHPRSPLREEKGEDVQTQLIGLLDKMMQSAEDDN